MKSENSFGVFDKIRGFEKLGRAFILACAVAASGCESQVVSWQEVADF